MQKSMIPSALATLTVSAAAWSGITVIYTKIPTSPTSIIPGAVNEAGVPVVTNFRAMEDIRVSPDGSRWVLRGRTQLTPDAETILMMGTGTTGSMFAQEGRPIPQGAAGELYDFFGSQVGQFNDNNEFAFSARAKGGVASVFQKVIRWSSGDGFSLAYQMGDLIMGLSDIPANPSGDETVGNSTGAIHLLNNGRIGAHDPTVLNISTTRRPVLYYKEPEDGPITGFKQVGLSTVVGFGGSGTQVLSGISDSFRTTPDGAHWMTTGTFGPTGSTTAIFVYDGEIRLQAGQAVPGSSTLVNTIVQTQLLSDGSWLARGLQPVSGVYAVKNGALLAKTGDAITPVSTENWANSFFCLSGNKWGDWLIAGKSNNADPGMDDVIVVNGNRVILREGDPVDVDGNGLFDDDAFVGRGVNSNASFVTDSVLLTGRREVYAIVNLRNGAGVDLQSSPSFGTPNAFVLITWCIADVDDGSGMGIPDGGVTVEDLLHYLNIFDEGLAAADVDDGSETGTPDGGVTVEDLLYFLARFDSGC